MNGKLLIWFVAMIILVTSVQGSLVASDYLISYSADVDGTDDSPIGNDGNLNGDLTINTTLYFLGVGSFDTKLTGYVETQNTVNFTGSEGAIGGWFYLRSTANKQVFGSEATGNGIDLQIFNGRLYGRVEAGAFMITRPLPAGFWYYVLMTWDGTAQHLYLGNDSSMTLSDFQLDAAIPTDVKFQANGKAGGAILNGLTDMIAIYDKNLTLAEVQSEWNTGLGNDFFLGGKKPSMDNTTWNLTSASAGNSTAWRTNQSYPIQTQDTTPTLTVNTDINANCRIGVSDVNWTVANSSRECSTTGGLNHTCSLAALDALILGKSLDYLYVSCTATDNTTMSPLSTSGSLALNTTYPSRMNVGLFNGSYVNRSLDLNEGEDFFVYANYTFSNGTAIDTGFCNFTANDIISESYMMNDTVNFSVCTSGCDGVNKSFVFTDLHTDGYISDIFRFKLCKEGSAPSKIITVSTNDSASYEISYGAVPLCSNGYVDIDVMDANSSGKPSLILSITSDAASSKALILVDTFGGVDRLHNASENMTFHVPSQTFVGEEHEYYTGGVHNLSVNCYGNTTSNFSGVVSAVIGNDPPTIFIDSIWWWLLSEPLSFTPSIQARYPVESSINITGSCQDTDLFNVGFYLNYTNSTTIYSETILVNASQPVHRFSQINFTKGNFSVHPDFLDGIEEYVVHGWCNDSAGNITNLIKNFAAINEKPISKWSASSGVIANHTSFIFNCTDAENEVVNTNYVFVNGTLNYTGISPFVFDFPEGSYELNISCNDSFRNSTQDSIIIDFNQACSIVVDGLLPFKRYRSTNQTIGLSCVVNATIDSCHVSVNKFAEEEFNCTTHDLILEIGRNTLDFRVESNGINSTKSLDVFAKQEQNGLSAYILLFVLLGVSFVLYTFFLSTSLPIYGVFSGIVILIVGFFIFSLSIIASIPVFILGVLIIVKSVF